VEGMAKQNDEEEEAIRREKGGLQDDVYQKKNRR
jgi:hypothetical protein